MKYKHLIGKQFDLGTQDCFNLTMDFFLDNFDIKIPNIARPHDWEADGLDLINSFYHLSGFKKFDAEDNWPPRPADVLVTTVGGRTPNHLVIYLGGNKIIHHQRGRLSNEETMRPVWRRFTSFILRHPDVPHIGNERPILQLEDILNDRFI